MSPNSNEEVAPHENVGNPSGQFDRDGSVDRGDFGSGARRYFDSRDQIEHEYYDRRRGPVPEGDRRGSVSEFRMDVDGDGPYGSYRGTYGRRFGSFEPSDGPRREEYYGYGRSDRLGRSRSSYGYDRSVSPFGRGYDYGMDGGYGYGDQDRYDYRRDHYGGGYGYGSDYGRRDFGRSQYGRGFGDYSDRYGYGYSGRPYGFEGDRRHSFGDDYGRYGYGGDYGRYRYGDDYGRYGYDSQGYGRYGYYGDQDKYGYGGDYGKYGYSRHGRNEYDTDYSRYSHGSEFDRYGYNAPRNYEQYGVGQYYGRDQGRYGRGMVGDDSYRGYYRDQSPYGYNRYGYRGRSGERDFRGSRSNYDQYRKSPYAFGQSYPLSRQGYDRYSRNQSYFTPHGESGRFPQDRFNISGRYSRDSWNRDNRYGHQGYRSPYNYNAGPNEYRRRHFGRSEYQQPFPYFSQESFRN